jgi:hypothetical protein
MSSFGLEKGFLAPNTERLPEAEEALYKVLVPENEKRAIQLDEFADLYDPEIIKRDKAYVQNLEGKFNADGTPESSKKFGKLFEAIINNQIENSDLMGPRADVIVPSRFDDIANGVDSIVRFKEEKGATSHLALAIDVTRSRAEIENKFSRIRSSIEDGKLSRIKYFKSKNFRGELKPVARVVIGADHAVTEDISDLILSFMRMKKTIADRRTPQSAKYHGHRKGAPAETFRGAQETCEPPPSTDRPDRNTDAARSVSGLCSTTRRTNRGGRICEDTSPHYGDH